MAGLDPADRRRGRQRLARRGTDASQRLRLGDRRHARRPDVWTLRARRAGTAVVASDIAADPRWSAEYRELALRARLARVLVDADQSLERQGARHTRDLPSPAGRPVRAAGTRLEPFAHLAAIAIERAQAMPADVSGEILDALRRSEDRYARAMEASGDGHTDWIVATDEFYASPRLLEMCGLPADAKFSGRADFVARFPVHPEDRERVVEAVNAHYAGSSTRLELDMRVLRRGETRWMHAIFLCSRDASGALLRVSTAVTDVTDRKSAEDELRLRKEELQRLMESVSDYLWSAEVAADGSNSYRYYSPVVERITGWPPEYLLESRERWVGLLHPLDRRGSTRSSGGSSRGPPNGWTWSTGSCGRTAPCAGCATARTGRGPRTAASSSTASSATSPSASSPPRRCARAKRASAPDRAFLRLVLGAGREPALHVPVEPGPRPDRILGRILDRQDALGTCQHDALVLVLGRAPGRARGPPALPRSGVLACRAGRNHPLSQHQRRADLRRAGSLQGLPGHRAQRHRAQAGRRSSARERSPLPQPDRALIRLVLAAGRKPALHIRVERGL